MYIIQTHCQWQRHLNSQIRPTHFPEFIRVVTISCIDLPSRGGDIYLNSNSNRSYSSFFLLFLNSSSESKSKRGKHENANSNGEEQVNRLEEIQVLIQQLTHQELRHSLQYAVALPVDVPPLRLDSYPLQPFILFHFISLLFVLFYT